MKKYIVSTTINNPTSAIQNFDTIKDWSLIVSGDQKTPKDYKLENGLFLSIEDQEKLSSEFECIKHINWNCIQRRNISTLMAIKEGADVIAFVDDDNDPYLDWGDCIALTSGFKCTGDLITSDNIVCDIMYHHENYLRAGKIWHRGFPTQLLEKRYLQTELAEQTKEVWVQSGLVDGDPDVDAICRIANQPLDISINSDKEFLVDPQKFTPFNTQNTLISGFLSIVMCLPINIGRMDDIWMSYIAQRIMRDFDKAVLFTGATVVQDRNEHDLVKDLEAEMIGYKHTLHFLNWLNSIQVQGETVLEKYRSIVNQLHELTYFPEQSILFMKAWIRDIEKIQAG